MPPYPVRVAAAWALVGRSEELGLLTTVLADGRARGVVVSGAAGVGKTRLAAELLAHAGRAGRVTEWVLATRSLHGIPFGAFAPLLRTGAGGPAGPLEVLGQAAAELRARSPDTPPVLVVDDAHLLDDASAGLAHQLAATAVAFVVATVRSGEPAPDAVRALWKDGVAERVDLQALSRAEVGRLLAAELGGALDGATAHRLWDTCRGNVLYLHELVRFGRETGRLAQRHGVWSWRGEWAAGTRLGELVADRLAGLGAAERSAMERIAVGEPLPSDLLAGDVDPATTTALEGRGLVALGRESGRGVLHTAHPLYGETLRAAIGPLRRAEICRELAAALAAAGTRCRDDRLRLALWQLEAGEPADPAALLDGGARARALFDHGQCERLARAALDAGGGAAAETLLGDALYWQGRHDEAAVVLGRVDPAAADPPALLEWALVASSNAFWGHGDDAGAQAVLATARDRLPAGSRRAAVEAHRSTLLLFGARPREALAVAAALLDEPGQDDETRLRLAVAAVNAGAAAGHCAAALELTERLFADMPALLEERPLLVGQLVAGQVSALFQAGRHDEMEALAQIAYEHVVTARAHDLRGMWALLLGRSALARGRLAAARDRLREAAALDRGIAERLVLSQRTVGNHLGNVYGKLGVAGRAELREVLGAPATVTGGSTADRGAPP